MDKRAITCRPCAEAKFAASQAQAERVGLTDAEIEEILHGEIALNPGEGCAGRFARAIERAHGIGWKRRPGHSAETYLPRSIA